MQIWIFTILLICYFCFHSLLALEGVKGVLVRYLVPSTYYRLGYNAFAIVSLIPVVWVYFQCPFEEILTYHQIFHWLGVGITLVGIIGNYIAIKQYDIEEFMGLSQLSEGVEVETMLVTEGWNAYVRHPLYLAALLIVLGVFIYAPYAVHLSILLVVTGYLFVGIMLEERKLVQQFGQDYIAYQRQVPMLFPRLWHKRRN